MILMIRGEGWSKPFGAARDYWLRSNVEVQMLACIDVDYRERGAVAACVLFDSWADGQSTAEVVKEIAHIEPYQPGQFYRRELPCLLAVLADVPELPTTIVVDGYVWLAKGRPGLGAHLYEALGRRTPVIGVAKSPFIGAPAEPVRRGGSQRPLYVSAAGMNRLIAAQLVQAMHGPYRLPTLLRRVDQLCRRRT
jgi:deoxyribonuclease V